MTEEEPWERYDRDRLPKGWAYPLGRDEVTGALVSAGVRLGSLSFSSGILRGTEPLHVLQVYWPSDARARYFHAKDFQSAPLMMFLSAVPSALRLTIGHALRDTWLQQAVAWAGQAPDRGNVWTASDHYWTLTYAADAGLTVETS